MREFPTYRFLWRLYAHISTFDRDNGLASIRRQVILASNGNTFHGCIKWSQGNNVSTIIKVQQNSPNNHKHYFAEHWIIQLQMHSSRNNTWTLNTAYSGYLVVAFLRRHKRRPKSRPLGRGMGVPREFRDHIAVVLRSDPDTSLQWRHSKRNCVIFGFCYVWSRYIESLW